MNTVIIHNNKYIILLDQCLIDLRLHMKEIKDCH